MHIHIYISYVNLYTCIHSYTHTYACHSHDSRMAHTLFTFSFTRYTHDTHLIIHTSHTQTPPLDTPKPLWIKEEEEGKEYVPPPLFFLLAFFLWIKEEEEGKEYLPPIVV